MYHNVKLNSFQVSNPSFNLKSYSPSVPCRGIPNSRTNSVYPSTLVRVWISFLMSPSTSFKDYAAVHVANDVETARWRRLHLHLHDDAGSRFVQGGQARRQLEKVASEPPLHFPIAELTFRGCNACFAR